jgi:hypothetical protein
LIPRHRSLLFAGDFVDNILHIKHSTGWPLLPARCIFAESTIYYLRQMIVNFAASTIKSALLRLAAATIFLCVTSVAHADISCTPFVDRANELAIGALALGMPKAELPRDLKKSDCGTAPQPGDEVCEYFDRDGFAYLADNQSIIRIEARLGKLNKYGVLPLGLRLGDTKKTVRKKIASAKKLTGRANVISTLGQRSQYTKNAWATHYCITNSQGATGSWYLNFDQQGRLITVGIRLNV